LNKAARRAEKRRLRNRVIRSTFKTYIKRAEALIAQGRLGEAEEAVRRAISALDRAAAKGVIHANNAARRKSRLMAKFNAARAAAQSASA